MKHNININFKCNGDGWKGKCEEFRMSKIKKHCKYSVNNQCINKKMIDLALTEAYIELHGTAIKTIEAIKGISETISSSGLDGMQLQAMVSKMFRALK